MKKQGWLFPAIPQPWVDYIPEISFNDTLDTLSLIFRAIKDSFISPNQLELSFMKDLKLKSGGLDAKRLSIEDNNSITANVFVESNKQSSMDSKMNQLDPNQLELPFMEEHKKKHTEWVFDSEKYSDYQTAFEPDNIIIVGRRNLGIRNSLSKRF